jgi:hypothetical protein
MMDDRDDKLAHRSYYQRSQITANVISPYSWITLQVTYLTHPKRSLGIRDGDSSGNETLFSRFT